MTVVLLDGFDNISASQLTAKGWSANPASVQAGSPDGQKIRLTGHGAGTPTSRSLPSALGTVILGFLFTQDQAPTTNTILRLLAGASRVMDLQINSTGSGATTAVLRVLNAAGGTVATGTTAISNNSPVYIEVKLVVGATGTVTVKINGVIEINAVTGNFGTSNVDGVQLMNSNSNGSTNNNSDFDDLYVIDPGSSPNNTYIADASHTPHIRTLYPDGDGSHLDWTPDTGSDHYSRVNENPPDGDTSYVHSATAGNRDSYTFQDLTHLTTINAVQINAYGKSDDLSSHQVALTARPGTTDYDSASKTLPTSGYTFVQDLRETNPDTAAAWAPSEVDAAEFGIKFVS